MMFDLDLRTSWTKSEARMFLALTFAPRSPVLVRWNCVSYPLPETIDLMKISLRSPSINWSLDSRGRHERMSLIQQHKVSCNPNTNS